MKIHYYREKNGTGHVMHFDENENGQHDPGKENFLLIDFEKQNEKTTACRALMVKHYKLYPAQLETITRHQFLKAAVEAFLFIGTSANIEESELMIAFSDVIQQLIPDTE
jgi:hypothetical protein